MREKAVWIPIVLFGVLLSGGFLWSVLQRDRAYSDTENRYLAARPEFSWQAVVDGSFMEDYEAYITDQFPERDRLVGLKTCMEAVLGRKEIKSVWLAGILLGVEDGYVALAQLADRDGPAAGAPVIMPMVELGSQAGNG